MNQDKHMLVIDESFMNAFSFDTLLDNLQVENSICFIPKDSLEVSVRKLLGAHMVQKADEVVRLLDWLNGSDHKNESIEIFVATADDEVGILSKEKSVNWYRFLKGKNLAA